MLLTIGKRTILFILIVVLWEISARLGFINKNILSSPTEIINTAWQLILSGSLFTDSAASIKRVLVGVLIGSAMGVLLGVLVGLSSQIKEYLTFIIELIRPIPPIAWIPIAILAFGIGDNPAYFLVSLGAFFPIFTSTIKGIQSIEGKFIDVAYSLGADKLQVLTRIIFPLLLPYLITGFRISLGVGWIIVITAELVGAQNGLGYMIQLNRTLLRSAYVIVGMLTIGFIGVLLTSAINFLEYIVIPWRRRATALSV